MFFEVVSQGSTCRVDLNYTVGKDRAMKIQSIPAFTLAAIDALRPEA
jgi:hypothetical protein